MLRFNFAILFVVIFRLFILRDFFFVLFDYIRGHSILSLFRLVNYCIRVSSHYHAHFIVNSIYLLQ